MSNKSEELQKSLVELQASMAVTEYRLKESLKQARSATTLEELQAAVVNALEAVTEDE